MIVSELSWRELKGRLRSDGLRLRTGPIVTSIRSSIDAVAKGISLHYGEHPLEASDGFADFHISVERPRNVRRWINPQVVFRFDGDAPFSPLPAQQAFPMLEWGLNWCISSHCHQYLTIHAAVVERAGLAMIFPAPPGSGKSTLCAGLAFRGWRLLSDELTLIEPNTGAVVPVPRPISLKNASIDVLRAFAPAATIGPAVHETIKGSVAHVKPPIDGVLRANETAMPRWVVLPRYAAGAEARLEPMSKGAAFMRLIDNSFNYNVHGRRGFDALANLIDGTDCYEFSYSQLGDAAAVFDRLSEELPIAA